MTQCKKQRLTSLVAEPPALAGALHTPLDNSNTIERIRPTLPELNEQSNVISVSAKRSHLTATEKLAVLNWYHANGRNQKATAAHFRLFPRYNKLNQGTISRWLAAEAKVRQAATNGSTRPNSLTSDSFSRNAATREKSLKHPELEKCLTLWLDNLDATTRTRLSGREIKTTARQIYDELEVPESERLELSNGWLARFQTRHGLKLHRRHSKMLTRSDEGDLEGERKRIQDDIRAFLAGNDSDDVQSRRSLDDVWSMETTTISLECSPMKLADGGHKDRKQTRITVGLAINATGMERMEPLFVGHDGTQQQGYRYYFSNRMGCMTRSIYCEWLGAWNQTLVEANRHVLLLVSKSCGKMADQTKLSNILLRFVSPTLTSHLQPCSVGLFKAFHTQYRKLVVHRALNKLRSMKEEVADGSTLFEMSDIYMMELAKAAWQLAGPDPKMAVSCWQKAKILPAPADAPEVSTTLIEAEAYIAIVINEEIVNLEQALQVLALEARSHHVSLSCMGANEFVLLGLNEGKCTDLSIKELVQLVVSHDKSHEDSPAKETPPPVLERSPMEEDHHAIHENSPTEKTPPSSPPSNQTSVTPEVVLHAQLILEQYWTQNNVDLPPAVFQVLQQTRSQLLQLQQASISSAVSTPP